METTKDNKKVIIKVIKILLIIVIWPLYLIFLVHKNEKITKSAKKVLYIILALVSLVWLVIWAALFQGDKNPDDVPVIENTAAPVTTAEPAVTVPVTTSAPVTTPASETEPSEETEPEEEAEPEETKPVKKPTNFSIPNGKLLSATEGGLNGDVLVIKTKIEYQFTNKATINQNFENIEKIIKSDTFKKYYRDDIKSIDYWAVADMTSGEESKAISFTVSENTINNLLDNDYFTFDSTNYEDHVQDLWILPSLNK